VAERFDAVVIGGGHNGLTCGAYLARAGLKTLVLERRHVIGGAAMSEEVIPGFTFSVFSYLMSLLHPKVIADLELRKHGFSVLPASDMFGPLPGGDYIVFSDDTPKTQKSFARFSAKDAATYPEFDCYLTESVAIVRKLLLETPPDPSCRDWKSFKETAGFLWKYRRIGGKLYRLIDIMMMSADAYLSEWFERTEIKALLAYYSGIGTFVGPKSPGSAYVIMHHLMGEHAGAGGWGFVRGGMGAISKAIAASGREKGLTIRTEAEVAAIDTAGGRTTGVSLADGTRIEAKVVASNVSAKLTFLKFLSRDALPAEFVRDVEAYRTYSGASRSTSPASACRSRNTRLSTHRPAAFPTRPTPISARPSIISNGPTTTPSTGTGRAIPSSRPWRRASSTTRSRRPESTSGTSLAAMLPTRSARATGRAARRNLRRTCFA
jgi:phytoene dehydrogenase-like protein